MSQVETRSSATQVDPLKFREVLGHYPTGVVLITAIDDDGEPVGMIVGTFASVSLDPPMVTYLPTRTSSTFARLRTSSSFCVNVLAADQNLLVKTFAGKGENKFNGVAWRPAPSGSPVLDGVVASIDCEVESTIEAGDHYIVLGAVKELEVHNPVAPLLFYQGGFGRFANLRPRAVAVSVVIEAARAAERGRTELEAFAERWNVECDVMVEAGDEVIVVATASASGLESQARLGQRTPLIPPLGEVFAAFGSDEVTRMWLQRISPVDEYTGDDYERRLRVTRDRGWSIARAGSDRDHEFADVARGYSADRLTPMEDRGINAIVAKVSADHAPIEFSDDGTYDLSGIVAPVFGHRGEARMAVRMTQLPAGATADQVTTWAAELAELSEGISRLGHPTESSDA